MTIRSLALAGAVAALLAGCATTPPGASPSPAATVSGQPTATTATTITEDTVDARNDAARAAIEAAENAGAGRAIDLTWTDDGWRIDVVAGDAERELAISGDGAQVVTDDPTPDHVDADAQAHLALASVSMRQAVDTVVDQIPGELVKAELTDDDVSSSGLRWDVTLSFDGNPVTLSIDAATGDLRE